MSIKIETTLSSARKLQLESLVFLCLKAFPAPLSVPTDGDVYFFMEEPSYLGNGSAELLGLLALYETEEHLWECSAFTRPDKRQEGIFSRVCHFLRYIETKNSLFCKVSLAFFMFL